MSKNYEEFFDELDMEAWLIENEDSIKVTKFVYETDANHILVRVRVYYLKKGATKR